MKFKIVLDFVGDGGWHGFCFTHESQVVGGHEVAEALKSSRPASDRNTERRLRIKPHTLFLISRFRMCVISKCQEHSNTKLKPTFGVCVCEADAEDCCNLL